MRCAHAAPVLALAVAVATGCAPKPQRRAEVAVRIETVAAAPSLSKGRYTGSIQARAQVDLSFRTGGYVEKITTVPGLVPVAVAGFPEVGEAGGHTRSKKPTTAKRQDRPIQAGDRVTRDMVLASLRHSDFKQRLAEVSGMSAESAAGYHKAKVDLDRARGLLAEGTISQADFDAIKARHDSYAGASSAAAARVGQAGIALGDASLKAPFDGVVLDRRVEVGALIAPGVPAFVLADTSMMKAVIGVPDGVQRELALGQEVLVSSDAVPGKRFSALITKIAAQADPRTRVFDVEATLDNSEGLLKVGMVTTVIIGRSVQEPTETQIVLPLSAVVRVPPNETGFWVYVASDDANGTIVSAREVSLGGFIGNRVSVTRGLAVGERVVVQGASIVTHGQRVIVVPNPVAPGAS